MRLARPGRLPLTARVLALTRNHLHPRYGEETTHEGVAQYVQHWKNKVEEEVRGALL